MILAQGLFDLGLSGGLLEVVRIIATVGAAVVGWFVCGPLARLTYWLVYRKATPGPVILGSKIIGATALSILIYFFMPLGGSGGFGFGPGAGGTPGQGPGKGGPKIADACKDAKTDANDKDKSDTPKTPGKIETVQIEILGGKRFVEDGKDRFYLVERKAPALSIADLDAYFKKHEAQINVVAILTKDTGIESDLIGSPLDKLRKSAAQSKIKVLISNED